MCPSQKSSFSASFNKASPKQKSPPNSASHADRYKNSSTATTVADSRPPPQPTPDHPSTARAHHLRLTPKPHPANSPPRTTAYASTKSPKTANSPSDTPANSTSSASEHDGQEPPSSCSPTATPSPSSTKTPAKYTPRTPSTNTKITGATTKESPADGQALKRERCLDSSHCGAKENRTPDLFIANETLYQLSYSPVPVPAPIQNGNAKNQPHHFSNIRARVVPGSRHTGEARRKPSHSPSSIA